MKTEDVERILQELIDGPACNQGCYQLGERLKRLTQDNLRLRTELNKIAKTANKLAE